MKSSIGPYAQYRILWEVLCLEQHCQGCRYEKFMLAKRPIPYFVGGTLS
ncbi:hypothetical protein [Photobacterium ganghwense]|nr:hypothetical protein [Photobacterium ganghwense]QSV17576.1 hypothetical protein FH974_26095 [Photobacterium ganghwense]